jgi:hypothetical protein
MKTTGCFLALLFCIFALPARAAAGDVTIFGGMQDPGGITLDEIRPARFGVFGVRYSKNTSFVPEYTIALAPNFIDSNTAAFILNTNLLMQAQAPAVKPYVTAGLGTVMTFFGDGPSDIGTKFAINYGLGVKVMGGSIGGRFDFRRYAIPGVQSQTLNVTEMSFGVVFGN